MNLQSILSTPGLENMGGFTNRLLFYPAHLMKTVPLLIKSPTSMDEYALASGTFEFVLPSDKPVAIYATDKTVSLKSENQGETDGQSFNITGEFFHPGSKVQVAAFARLVNNTPGYLLLETPEGDQIIIGQPGLPCNIKPSFDGGKARADRRGFSFTFQADSFVAFTQLKAPIDLDPLFIQDTQTPSI